MRKRTLEYDDVMNKQREVIYGFRDEVINADDVRDRLMDIMEEVVIQKVQELTPDNAAPEEWQPGRWPTGSTSISPSACRRRKSSRPPSPGEELPWKAPPSTASARPNLPSAVSSARPPATFTS